MTDIKAPRGAPDVLPPVSELLAEVETAARSIFDRYGYRPVHTPLFEHTEVFVRTIGESSDIVRKEMYTFTDRADRSLTLRPEGTAPVVRAVVEHKLLASMPLPVRLAYWGPMFRYERPQKGRTRQFIQGGVECLGSGSPLVDAEVILLTAEFFEAVGLQPDLLLNSMGCEADRQRYAPVLRGALADQADDLCDDCRERLKTNPLRVFDCKVATCREIVRASVPPIREFLCEECSAHHRRLEESLETLGMRWSDAPDLVRGFDYYSRTVFEFDLPSLGARTAVAGGGRYDGLVQHFGGPPTPAVGMAIGVEPTMVALQERGEPDGWRPEAYVVWLDGHLAPLALAAARDLRAAGVRVATADEARSMRAQLRAADRLGARTAVILGERDVGRGVVTIKDLQTGTQKEVPLSELAAHVVGEVPC